MFDVSSTGPSGRELRAHHTMTGALVSLVVRLKNGHLHQCFPPEFRGAVYPSEEIWRASVRDQLQRERVARGQLLRGARKDAQAAVETLRSIVRCADAAKLKEYLAERRAAYDRMTKEAEAVAWRGQRAKKHRQRALDAVRDPLEPFVGEEA